MFLGKKVEVAKKKALDYASLWSKNAGRKHHYNRMDPDPDSDTGDELTPRARISTEADVEDSAFENMNDEEREELEAKKKEKELKESHSKITRDKEGNIRKVLTRDDWRKFWADRLRRKVSAPHLSDKDIADSVERGKRVYMNKRAEDSKPYIDPDLPACYYWDKFQVAEWAETLNLPTYIPIKEIILSSEISGRILITLDANTLIKLGIYELNSVKMITKAVRQLLGIPPPNTVRAIARSIPLEKYLLLKIPTGITVDKMTFREFCEKEGINYEGAKLQMIGGYKPIPDECRVIVKPWKNEDVQWIPMSPRKKPARKLETGEDSPVDSLLESNEEDGNSEMYLYDIPTVEELCNNSISRNAVIPQIINEIVERVYHQIHALEVAQERQELADQVFRTYMAKVYSDFSVFDSEDRLRFVTIIAEELADDIIRAREVLEDIDEFQKRLKNEMPEGDMINLQDVVSHYVQSIMPFVVSAAVTELKFATNLHLMDRENLEAVDSIEIRNRSRIRSAKSPRNKSPKSINKINNKILTSSDSGALASGEDDEVEVLYKNKASTNYPNSLHMF